ncbi:hypothetical protein [Hasllibacter sp. MH4015]|uniref:hypothetical protein n=1 Tax=Hasllibacter sp. MH4015 TaxID=2854029 RepID=UPI001CD1D2D4|nr:hypothetical protein [Hasllibacter sp. MH4015]
MMRQIALPLAGLLAVAGALGLFLGLRSAPPSETEVIDAQAAAYVAETGGDLTDCYGVPAGVENVWLIVICEREGSEAWYQAVDRAGVPVDDEVIFGEDET